MNSRQRRRLRRFSERLFKAVDLSGNGFRWIMDQEQPGIGERIITGQIEITRDLIEFGIVKDY